MTRAALPRASVITLELPHGAVASKPPQPVPAENAEEPTTAEALALPGDVEESGVVGTLCEIDEATGDTDYEAAEHLPRDRR